MSEELQKPPVIDIETILQPISEDEPSGEYLRYSGDYDQISEARRADKDLSQGEWQTELKVADFRQAIDLSVNALIMRSKDLQIGVWLGEALISIHGFIGLRDAMKVLSGLQEIFWETLHPEIEDGDMEGRANAISWFDTEAALLVKKVKITGGEGYNYFNWEDSKKYDIPDNIDTLEYSDQDRYRELAAEAERDRRITGDLWRKEKAKTNRAFCEEANFAVEECWTQLAELNRVIEEKYDRNQMPGLSTLKNSLDEVHTQIKKLLEEKRAEEPNEDDTTTETVDAETGEITVVSGGAMSASGAIASRKDALKRLSDIADFFQKTEPHSPVSHLVTRAVKWGNMPLDGWLQDVIKDEGVLYQIRQTLGFNTGNTDQSSEY